MKDVAASDDYGLDRLKETHPSERTFFSHTFIDGVFLLDRGFVLVDSQPFMSLLANHDKADKMLKYIWACSDQDELTMLWVLINFLNRELLWNNFEFTNYLGDVFMQYSD